MTAVKPDGETRDSCSGCPSGHPPRIAQRSSPGGRRRERGQPPPRPRRCDNSGMHAACSATQAGNRPHRARAAHTPHELSPSFLPPLLQARDSSRTAKATPPRARRGARYRRAPAEAPPANRRRGCGGRIRSTPPYRQAALRLRAQSSRLSASLRYQASGKQRCRRRPRAIARKLLAIVHREVGYRRTGQRLLQKAKEAPVAARHIEHTKRLAGRLPGEGGDISGKRAFRTLAARPRIIGALASIALQLARTRHALVSRAFEVRPLLTAADVPAQSPISSRQRPQPAHEARRSTRTTRRSRGRRSRLCHTAFGRFQHP